MKESFTINGNSWQYKYTKEDPIIPETTKIEYSSQNQSERRQLASDLTDMIKRHIVHNYKQYVNYDNKFIGYLNARKESTFYHKGVALGPINADISNIRYVEIQPLTKLTLVERLTNNYGHGQSATPWQIDFEALREEGARRY